MQEDNTGSAAWEAATAKMLKEDAKEKINNNIYSFANSNPDQAARDESLSRMLQIPVDAIETNRADVERQARIRELDAGNLVEKAPVLSRMLEDPRVAKIMHDDIPSAKAIEETLRPMPEFRALPERSIGERVSKWFGDLFGIDDHLKAQAWRDWATKQSGMTGDQARAAVGGMSEMPSQIASKFINSATFGIVPDIAGESKTSSGVVGSAVGGLAGFLTLPVMSSTKAVGLTGSLLERATKDSFAKALGKDVIKSSLTLGIASGLAETGKAINSPDIATAARKTGTATLHGAEMGALFGTIARALPDPTLIQFAGRATLANIGVDALSGTSPLTTVENWDKMSNTQKTESITNYLINTYFSVHGAGRAGGGWWRDAAKADIAEQDYQALSNSANIAASSKWRERDPESFKNYVRNVAEDGHIENVYVDAKTFVEAFNQSGITPEEFAQKMPDIAKQIGEAEQVDGYVKIPVADFSTHMAGFPIGDALLQHLRTDPDAMTYKEALDFKAAQSEAMQAEAKTIAAQEEVRTAFQKSKQDVQLAIEQQLNDVKRFTPEVNKIYAKLQSELIGRIAEREKITPTEANAKYGSSISVASGGQALADARGSYSPAERIITLNKEADLSTFVHESGHWIFDTYARIASHEQGAPDIKGDVDALLKWGGIDSLERWNALDLNGQRDLHEKVARGFEAYLMEGKAPSAELQPIFQRIRSWMVSIYRSLRGLNIELSKEIQQVFDRMLASEDAIAEAERARVFEPIAKDAPDGVTPEAWAEYQQIGRDATENAIDAIQGKSLKDLQWLDNAKSKILRAKQREAASARREIRAEAEKEIAQQPIERVRRWLKTGELEKDGELIKAEQGFKFNAKAVDELFPESALDRPDLSGLRGMKSTDGLHPDLLADMFGFRSGEQLIRELLNEPSAKDKAAELTDQRMLEQHGELSTPEAIAESVSLAIHNDARARFMATGLKILAKSPISVRELTKGAREAAQAAIAQKKVRELNPRQYEAGEARANKEVIRLAAKDIEGAVKAQRSALLNNQLVKAARDAQIEVRGALDYFKRLEKDAAAKSIGAEHIAQIEGILERFDLRQSTTNKEIAQRASLADWLRAQEEQGIVPDIPESIANEAYKISYKDMTVEELRGLVDTVKQIEHLGRNATSLFLAGRRANYEATRDSIVQSIEVNAKDKPIIDERTATTDFGKTLQSIKRFGSSHIKIAQWARILDGGKDGGKVWEYMIRPANERGNFEVTMRAEATKKLTEILEPVYKAGAMSGRGEYFPTIGRSLNRQEKIAIALNVGNESNMQRLLDGEKWKPEQLQPILSSLTKAEWEAVQGVWDFIETYKPLIAEKEKRIYGKEPEWIEPRAFKLQAADGEVSLKGGYYPAVYDPMASMRAETHADAEAAKRQMQGAYTSATTRRTFTKSRVSEVHDRPLMYSLSGLYNHVNDVIHDLAWHEWLIDTNKLMRSHSIDTAIREKYGVEVKRQIKSWVNDIAEGGRGAYHPMDVALGWLRKSVSSAGLAFNVMSAAMQPLGITQSFVRVGAKYAAIGVQKYISSPLESTREAQDKSEFMRNRGRTRLRELNEIANKVQGQSTVLSALHENAFYLTSRAQQMVDVPTWHGAYEKAIAEGNNEARAIDLADQAVIDSQGNGDIKDLSAIERGGAAQKLFTTFYSFMNTALNVGVEKAMTEKNRGVLSANMAMLYVAPVILTHALKSVLTPSNDDGEIGMAELGKKLAAEEIDYLMGMMVVTREFSDAVKTLFGEGNDYSAPSGLRMIGDTGKFVKQAAQGEFDTAFRKSAINIIGDLTGLPSAQANRTITGIEALSEGKTNNPLAITFGFHEKR